MGDLMKVLYVCSTPYHVLISILKQMQSHVKSDLVICDDVVGFDELAERVRRNRIFNQVFILNQIDYTVPAKIFFTKPFLIHVYKRRVLKKKLLFDFGAYDQIYIYHDGTAIGQYLNDLHIKYHLVEDSLNFYQRIRSTSQFNIVGEYTVVKKLLCFFNIGYHPLGYSRYVLDIEVNDKKNILFYDKNVIEVPRKNLTSNLSLENKRILSNIFDYTSFNLIGGKVALILTEPLDKDWSISSDEQIRLYRFIVDDLVEKKYLVHIKPHPRDNCNYEDFNCILLSRFFPVELMDLIDNIFFDVVISISSSSLYSIKSKSHVCLGREFINRL